MTIKRLAEFLNVDSALFVERESKNTWYGKCHQLGYSINNKETVQVSFYSEPISKYGRRDLLQIHGLCFSDSSLNMLRPFSISRLIWFCFDHGANVSKLDLYIDDFTGSLSQKRLDEMSAPNCFDEYIQSPFLKAAKGGNKPLPRPYGDDGNVTWYYGSNASNSCDIISYNKGLSPRQKIHSKANPIKFTWRRFEIRLSSETAKRVGKKLIADLIGGENLNTCITTIFKKYLRFTEPNPNNQRQSCWPLQSWYKNLLDSVDKLPAVIIDGAVRI